MKILVTGGAGFIGSNFIRYWLKKYPKDLVVNLDILTYAGNLDNLKDVEKNSNYRFIRGNICDTLLINRVMKGIDIIVHFAAESHVDRSIKSPETFLQTNVLGTQILLNAAVGAKIKRFHHISTDEVFGALNLDNNKKFNEQSIYNPASPYAASKAASDHLVRAYHITYGLNITITNCSNNFGPFQYPEKLIPLAITNILEGKKVPIYGDGKYMRDWLYVEDHCRAIDLVLQNGKSGETYCVGGLKKEISNLDIVNKILSILGKDSSCLSFVADRPGHDRKYAIDWSKLKKELGWQPEFDLDTYLEKTVSWYQKNISWWKKLKTNEYYKYYKDQYSDL